MEEKDDRIKREHNLQNVCASIQKLNSNQQNYEETRNEIAALSRTIYELRSKNEKYEEEFQKMKSDGQISGICTQSI